MHKRGAFFNLYRSHAICPQRQHAFHLYMKITFSCAESVNFYYTGLSLCFSDCLTLYRKYAILFIAIKYKKAAIFLAKHLKKSSGKCSNRLSLNALAVVLCLSILFFAVWSLFVSQDNSMYNGDSEETAEMETQSMDAEPQENTTGYLAVLLGETGQLDSTYTWITTDSTVATVDENGVVTGLSVGRCQMIVNETDDCIQIIVRALEEIDGCTYIDDILIVNKTYGLPESYDPGLQPEVESAFAVLAEDAALEGLDIYIGSSYRSYAF